MKALATFLIGVAFFAVTLFAVAALIAFPVKWLWNYAAVSALGAHTIDFWQALCLNLLCGILVRAGSASTARKE